MKAISVSELKTHLSREIRKVRKGQTLVITDHDHPVAKLSPAGIHETLVLTPAEKPMNTLLTNRGITVKTDPLKILQEERNR